MPPSVVFGNNVQLLARRNMPGTGNLPTKSLEFSPLATDLPQDPFNVDPPGYNNPYMVVKINYETNPINDGSSDPEDPTTFLEVSFDATAEFMKVPGAKHNFVTQESATEQGNEDGSSGSGEPGGPDPLPDGPKVTAAETNIDTEIPITIVVPTTTYNLNWKLALNPNFGLFRSLMGRVNLFTDPLFYNAPPGTILFLGFSGSRSFLWDGEGETSVTPWNLTFKFVGRHIEDAGGEVYGWQHIYRPSSGKFEIVRRRNLNFIYNSVSTFSQMFRAGGLL